MIKKILFAVFTASFLMSCATTGGRIVEDAGTLTGARRPSWVSKINSKSAIADEFPGKVPFTYSESGSNLNLLRRRVNTTTLAAEYSRVLSTAIAQSALDMASGSSSSINEQEFRDSISAASKAQFSGFMKEGDWWVKREKTVNGQIEEEYTYFVLYLVDEATFKRNLSSSIKNSSQVIDSIGEDISTGLQNNIDNVADLYLATE